jgi:hypothetical protein
LLRSVRTSSRVPTRAFGATSPASGEVLLIHHLGATSPASGEVSLIHLLGASGEVLLVHGSQIDRLQAHLVFLEFMERSPLPGEHHL